MLRPVILTASVFLVSACQAFDSGALDQEVVIETTETTTLVAAGQTKPKPDGRAGILMGHEAAGGADRERVV